MPTQAPDTDPSETTPQAKENSRSGAFADQFSILRSKTSRNTMLLGVMFLLGAGWIAMKSGKTKVYSPDEQSLQNELLVNTWLADAKKNPASSKGRDDYRSTVVSLTIGDVRRKQVPVAELSKNPYAFLHFPKDLYPLMIDRWKNVKDKIGREKALYLEVLTMLLEKEQFAKTSKQGGELPKTHLVTQNSMIEYLAKTQAQEEAWGRYEVYAADKMKLLLADARDGMSDSAKQGKQGLARKLAEEEAWKEIVRSAERLELQSILQGD
ncbi:MAG TPA: hypothetical protein ENH84_02260, partial [Phycisphaerae bacterium]|nr:hypothetical protein [Phycisphaerae bacterium]